MLERRYTTFQSIQRAFLNEEEKAFTTVLLEYLLRLNQNEEEWAERLEAFEQRYPSSRFLNFVRSVKPHILKPTHRAFGIYGGLSHGSWRGQLERTLRPYWGFDVGLYYWQNRWNTTLAATFGGCRLARDFGAGNEIWPKGSTASLWKVGLEVGYDILSTPKLRVFPAVGAYVSGFGPMEPSDEDEENPEYYANFEYLEGHLAASLTADLKLFTTNYQVWDTPKGSYHGVRLQVGYHRLRYGRSAAIMQGDAFFFTLAYQFFAFQAAKK
jgi:hypothetical protein